MMFRHGLRVSEETGLRLGEPDLGRSRLWVHRLKGGPRQVGASSGSGAVKPDGQTGPLRGYRADFKLTDWTSWASAEAG